MALGNTMATKSAKMPMTTMSSIRVKPAGVLECLCILTIYVSDSECLPDKSPILQLIRSLNSIPPQSGLTGLVFDSISPRANLLEQEGTKAEASHRRQKGDDGDRDRCQPSIDRGWVSGWRGWVKHVFDRITEFACIAVALVAIMARGPAGYGPDGFGQWSFQTLAPHLQDSTEVKHITACIERRRWHRESFGGAASGFANSVRCGASWDGRSECL